MTEERKIYNSEEVANLLHIQESTLRKYCILLKEKGYRFLENEFGHRSFLDEDLVALRKLQTFKTKGNTLKKSAEMVLAWKNGSVSQQDMAVISYNDLVLEFKEFKMQQQAFSEELIKELEKQRQYIDTRLNERDQALMLALKETLETRKLIAAADENKKKWWQFWK